MITPEEVLLHKNPKDVIYLPEPTAKTVKEADKLPGKWTDEQELSLETFKEIVAADVENVWVVAYIDPRCRDCYVLSVEWEKLTQIEEKEKRKIKLGYVDISVEETDTDMVLITTMVLSMRMLLNMLLVTKLIVS